MKLIPDGVTRSIAMSVFKTKQNSPHIFFVGGVLGMIGTTVLACRATLRLDKDLDEIKNDVHAVKELANAAGDDSVSGYREHEYYRDLGHVYIKSAVRLGKLYGPSVLLGVASVGALSGSHVQLTRRNAALTATLAAVSKAYDEYRLRIQQEIGEEREYEIYHGIEEVIDEETGKKVKVINPTGYSMYAKVFDETCENWFPDPERNRHLIMLQQKYFNHKLQSRGHVLLNDVYDALGFNRTVAGCLVGWLRDGDGDGFIDFGLFDGQMAARFINGLEGSIILDFNVDGNIYQKIEEQ